jgi:hypothetical protein
MEKLELKAEIRRMLCVKILVDNNGIAKFYPVVSEIELSEILAHKPMSQEIPSFVKNVCLASKAKPLPQFITEIKIWSPQIMADEVGEKVWYKTVFFSGPPIYWVKFIRDGDHLIVKDLNV